MKLSSRALGALVLAGTVTVVGAGCSSSASTRSADQPAAATPVAQVSAPASVPAGVTLRVGDQLDNLKTVLHIAGQDKNLPYKVQYSAFVGGPPMLQAFEAGAIDAGFIGSTPLIFAQAAGQDITAVASWATQNSLYRLTTAPGEKSITSWSDLKGKKVAYQQGTALEAALLEQLDDVHLKLSDITTVNVPVTQVSTALQGHAADVGILVEPLNSAYLATNPTAEVVGKTTNVTDRSSFMIASKKALTNSGTSAALADYIQRLAKAYKFLAAHPEDTAKYIYEDIYGLKPATANEIVKEAGSTSFIALPGDVLTAQQRLADLFLAAGEIPGKVTVNSEFDGRFNDLVQEAQAS
jgi:sulfonate transport system substrate-binding protein